MADETDETTTDICRVCRSESTTEKPLFHPCLCRGSIKFVHQDCLTQWLKYSKKEFCELCNHKYIFTPIYHPDMPKRLPIRDFVIGLMSNVCRAFQFWLHYTLVAVSWLGVVPLTACRVHRCLFRGSFGSIFKLPFEIMSTENIFVDCLHGIFIMALTLSAFVSLVWLREQIIHGGPLQWNAAANANAGGAQAARAAAPGVQQANDGDQAAAAADQEQLVDPEPDQLAAEADPQLPPPDAADDAQQEEPAAAPANPENGAADREAEDAANWQPFEWGPAGGEDLTWERLLGLDGSLLFLEHVFWVISLNALFLVVFAYFPYHIGNMSVHMLGVRYYIEASQFDRLTTTLLGYFVTGFSLYCMQTVTWFFKLKKIQRVFGMCYLVVKVFLLILMEIGIFPLICGFWLDLCSLLLFSTSLRDRVNSFQASPGTSAFLHWLVGMIYVFYFASFVLLLREVLRPGVLWFLRNLNDPEFNPIQEMIQFPIHRHLRRFVASLIMFGLTIVIIVYFPIKIILNTYPPVLPYNIHLVSLNSTSYLNIETSLSELSLELLLLQVILPALLEQSHARQALKLVIKAWCLVVAKFLNLSEYLLPAETLNPQTDRPERAGDRLPFPDVVQLVEQPLDDDGVPLPPQQQPVPHANQAPVGGGNLGAEHQALLLGGGARASTASQSYTRPTWFTLRIILLLTCLAVSALLASLICLTLPVIIGRQVIFTLTGHQKVHELYTMACGLYVCWLMVRLAFLLVDYLPWGVSAIMSATKFWFLTIVKCITVALPIIGLVPLLLGVLFQLVLVVPLRVNVNQSPLFFHWQDWAMGILHCKILCALIMMGPDWKMKRVFDRIYQDGFRNLSVMYIYAELIAPTVIFIGCVIAVPYTVAHGVAPMIGLEKEDEMLLQRHIYPSLLMTCLSILFFYWQFKQVCNLLQRIRNERYLVGQRLVNYDRSTTVVAAPETAVD